MGKRAHGLEIGNFYRWNNAVLYTRKIGPLTHIGRRQRQFRCIQMAVGINPAHGAPYFLRCTNKLRLKSSG
jgi:hypothetical protein